MRNLLQKSTLKSCSTPPEYAADKQADVKEKAAAFAEGYKKFMDSAKTEREAAVVSEQMLLAAGYKAFEPKNGLRPR